MELICECGATKSNWVVINKNAILSKTQLGGINLTVSASSINVLNEFKERNELKFDAIHYYSAGIYGHNVKEILTEKFNQYFPGIQIYFYSDILAAARSVSNGATSIVSILGTGSNTVLFDGIKIIQAIPSLGYLFGDFGSGFHIGKLIVNAFYLDQMNPEDNAMFEANYISNKIKFKKEIYQSDKPNSEIACFSYFLGDASEEFRKKILSKAFESFFENLMSGLKYSNNYKLNFVGSIAYVFKNELVKIAKEYNYQIENIVKDPLEGLIRYHHRLI